MSAKSTPCTGDACITEGDEIECETTEELRPIAYDDRLDPETQLRCFVLGFVAACLRVRAGRFLVAEFATHKLVQRKLNEASDVYRIPPRQYTAIRKSLTSPINAWRLNEAIGYAEKRRAEIEALGEDPVFQPIL